MDLPNISKSRNQIQASFVTQRQQMRLFAVHLVLSNEQKYKARSELVNFVLKNPRKNFIHLDHITDLD